MIAVTKKESHVWTLRFKGLNGTEIAKKLEVTRQAISKTLKNVDAKILRTLNENAGMMGLAVTSVDTERGILLGYHPQTRTKTMVFYLPKSGIQSWFQHDGECEGCITKDRCMSVLMEASEFWEVPFEEGESPTKIAEKLFEKVWR